MIKQSKFIKLGKFTENKVKEMSDGKQLTTEKILNAFKKDKEINDLSEEDKCLVFFCLGVLFVHQVPSQITVEIHENQMHNSVN